jgi:hypothetical protein
VNFFRQIGGSFGTAIIGSLFLGRLATNLQHNLPPSFLQKLGGHAQGVTPAELAKFPPPIAHGYIVSFANALTPLFAYLAPVILLGFVIAWFLKEKPLSATLARGAAAQKAPDAPAQQAQYEQGPDEQGVTAPESAAGLAPAVPDGEPGGRGTLSAQHARALNAAHPRSAGVRRVGDEPLPQRLFTPQQAGSNGTGNGNGAGNGYGGDGDRENGHFDGSSLAVTGSVYRAEGTATTATVTLLDLAGRQLEGASTDAEGAYHVTLPGPGTYLLAVLPERDGGQHPVAELITSAGDTVVRDIQLGES